MERGAPSSVAVAAEHVLAKLHAHLTRWFGVEGAHALMARALDRVRAGHPALGDARIEPRGEHTLGGLAPAAPLSEDAEMTEALAAVIAAVIELLTRLIGADLVSRVLQQTWPGESAGTRLAEGAPPHDAPGAPENPNPTRPDHSRANDTRMPE